MPRRHRRGWTQTNQRCFKEHHQWAPSQLQYNSNTSQDTMNSLSRPVSSDHSVGSHFSRLWKNDLSASTAVHCTAEPIKSKVQFDTALPRGSVNEKQSAGHCPHLLFLCVDDRVGRECVWVKRREPEQEIIVLLCFTAAIMWVTVEKRNGGGVRRLNISTREAPQRSCALQPLKTAQQGPTLYKLRC